MSGDPMLAKIVAGFLVEERVSTGPLANVYRARRGDEPFALKIYKGVEPAALERIGRERRVQTHIVHPSIARLCDSGILPDGSAYLASTWIEGPLLEERLSAPIDWLDSIA